MVRFIKWFFAPFTKPQQPIQQKPTPAIKPIPEMDEGDHYSGPAGYTPNTGYPETQYGSGFNEEAEWNDHEH